MALPAGAHRLLVRGLPAGIDRNLVTVGLEGAGVRLGGVDVETVNEGDYVAPRERELRARLEALTDQRAAIQDEVDTAQTQLKLLESLAANPTGGVNGSAAVNGANLGAVLASVGSSAAAARTRVREAKLRQRARGSRHRDGQGGAGQGGHRAQGQHRAARGGGSEQRRDACRCR